MKIQPDTTAPPQTLRGHLLGTVATKLITYGVIPAFGILGMLACKALGYELPGSLDDNLFGAAQLSGIVVIGILFAVVSFGIMAYMVVVEVWRWNRDPKSQH